MENKHLDNLERPGSPQKGWHQLYEQATQSVTFPDAKRQVSQVSAVGKGGLVLLIDDNEIVRELKLAGGRIFCLWLKN